MNHARLAMIDARYALSEAIADAFCDTPREDSSAWAELIRDADGAPVGIHCDSASVGQLIGYAMRFACHETGRL